MALVCWSSVSFAMVKHSAAKRRYSSALPIGGMPPKLVTLYRNAATRSIVPRPAAGEFTHHNVDYATYSSRLDVGVLDHLAPARGLGLDHGGKLVGLRRAAALPGRILVPTRRIPPLICARRRAATTSEP